jgi:hypothetical protein
LVLPDEDPWMDKSLGWLAKTCWTRLWKSRNVDGLVLPDEDPWMDRSLGLAGWQKHAEHNFGNRAMSTDQR